MDVMKEENDRLRAHMRAMAEELDASRASLAEVVAVWDDIAWLQDRQDQVAGLNRLPARVVELSMRLRKALDKVEDIDGERERAEEQFETERGKVGGLEERIRQGLEDAARLRAEVEAKGALVASSQEARARVAEQLSQADADLEKRTADAANAAALIRELESQLEGARESKAKALRELDESSAKNRALQGDLTRAKTQLEASEVRPWVRDRALTSRLRSDQIQPPGQRMHRLAPNAPNTSPLSRRLRSFGAADHD